MKFENILFIITYIQVAILLIIFWPLMLVTGGGRKYLRKILKNLGVYEILAITPKDE